MSLVVYSMTYPYVVMLCYFFFTCYFMNHAYVATYCQFCISLLSTKVFIGNSTIIIFVGEPGVDDITSIPIMWVMPGC